MSRWPWWRSRARLAIAAASWTSIRPTCPRPVRIDFFGDEIDTIRTFDPGTQRSLETLPADRAGPRQRGAARMGPGRAPPRWRPGPGELHRSGARSIPSRARASAGAHLLSRHRVLCALPLSRAGTLLDYLPDNTLVLVDDILSLETAALGLENQAISLRAEMIRDGELPANYSPCPTLPGRSSKPGWRARGQPGLSGARARARLLGRALYRRAPLWRADRRTPWRRSPS